MIIDILEKMQLRNIDLHTIIKNSRTYSENYTF